MPRLGHSASLQPTEHLHSTGLHHSALFQCWFGFPKNCISDSLDHPTGAPWGLGRMPLKRPKMEETYFNATGEAQVEGRKRLRRHQGRKKERLGHKLPVAPPQGHHPQGHLDVLQRAVSQGSSSCSPLYPVREPEPTEWLPTAMPGTQNCSSGYGPSWQLLGPE